MDGAKFFTQVSTVWRSRCLTVQKWRCLGGILQIPLDSRQHATAGKQYLQVLYRTHAAEC